MPWYILTNDEQTTNKQIIRYYYHRFEIEERFQDMKSLFRLKYTRLRTYRSLQVVLVFLSIALLFALMAASKQEQIADAAIPAKKRMSMVRQWQESLQSVIQATTVRQWRLG